MAFGDESGGHHNEDPGVFILTASVLASSDVDTVRAQLTPLRTPGRDKLHRRHETEVQRKRNIVAVVVAAPCHHHVVVRVAAIDRPERRRAKALEQLLIELEARLVATVTLESRTKHQDQLDLNVLAGLRAQKRVRKIRLEHVDGRKEPMVRMPDVVCGIIADGRIGEAPQFRLQLDPHLTEYFI